MKWPAPFDYIRMLDHCCYSHVRKKKLLFCLQQEVAMNILFLQNGSIITTQLDNPSHPLCICWWTISSFQTGTNVAYFVQRKWLKPSNMLRRIHLPTFDILFTLRRDCNYFCQFAKLSILINMFYFSHECYYIFSAKTKGENLFVNQF